MRKLSSIIFLIAILLGGCTTVKPIQKKYQDLEVLYKSGKLTIVEYTASKQKIILEELERAKAMSQADNKALRAKREDR